MKKMSNRYLVVAFIILVVLFLYFGIGTMMDGGMHESINENGWMGVSSWGFFPALVTFGLLVFIGWLIFRKKAKL